MECPNGRDWFLSLHKQFDAQGFCACRTQPTHRNLVVQNHTSVRLGDLIAVLRVGGTDVNCRIRMLVRLDIQISLGLVALVR